MGSENLIGRVPNAAAIINNRFATAQQSKDQFDFTATTQSAVASKAIWMLNRGAMTPGEAVATLSLPKDTTNYIRKAQEAADFAQRTNDTETAQLYRETLAAMLRYQTPK